MAARNWRRLRRHSAECDGASGATISSGCAITADTALRLAAFFGTDPKSWLNLQSHYDTEKVREAMEKTPAHIRRSDELAAA
jgi:plasmid maintenance system antidote protein VapI